MYYTYILQSKKDENFYTGYTNNLKKRVKEHNSGKVLATKNRVPLELVYYEACLNQQDATHREKYLKTAWGKRYVKSRLENYLTGFTPLDMKLSNGVNYGLSRNKTKN
ncbi:MAG: GIY-YIG nuclease family protein [Deltaproteobacteria bacterium]|nr:GIY-YIG nuclease family protein [Deltaproteobacteria bacterium]